MADIICLIVFFVTLTVMLIYYHYAVRDQIDEAYWEGFWEGHAIAVENAAIQTRLDQLDESKRPTNNQG